jgi:hypothetical protein
MFIDVSPEDIPNLIEGRRGRVSYPLIKGFLESGKKAAQLDRAGIKQSVGQLNMCLNSYLKNHKLPIKIIIRSGELYFLRTDVDSNGNIIDTLSENVDVQSRLVEPVEITPEVTRQILEGE